MRPRGKSKDITNTSENQRNTQTPFYNKKRLLLELVTIFFLIIMFGTAFYVHPLLPDKIPTHWNAAGEPDAFGGRNSIFIIPITFLIVSILLFVLPLMEVFRENMLQIYDYYYAFKVIFSIFFTVLFTTTLLPTLGYDINVSYVVIAMIGILFIALGFILPKLKRNYMFGIRTGWTLSSDKVWDTTHKLGGILFGALGILTILLIFILKLQVLFFVFLALTIAVSLFLVFYSYYIYKKDT